MAEVNTQEVRSNADRYRERIRGRYPDKEFADDEAYFAQSLDDYDEFDKKKADYETRISEIEGREKMLGDFYKNNPRGARLMLEWRDGADPVTTLLRIYGKDEILAAIEDPDKMEEIEKANEDFHQRVIENDRYEKEYNENLPQSLDILKNWAEEKGLSDDEANIIMESLSKLASDYITGKWTTETLDMLYKAKDYDDAVEQAQMEGEVAGRNAKIDEKLRKGNKTDGTVHLDGKGEAGSGRAKMDLGALDRYDGSHKSIWDVG